MDRRVVGILIVVATLTVALAAAAQQNPGRTVLDGVYSDAQAKRGEAEYTANCAKCHEGECPEGSPLGTPLFIERWREENLSFLFGFMKTRMPAKAEGSLSDAVYLDILTYLLRKNEYPAGDGELTLAGAATTRFVGKDGPKPIPTNALVQVTGCFVKDPALGWTLTNATPAARTLEGNQATAQELSDARARPRGTLKFELQDLDVFRPGFKPEPLTGHKVHVKGALIRQNTGIDRLIVTSVESLAPTCS